MHANSLSVRSRLAIAVATVAFILTSTSAQARIKIKFFDEYDSFAYHAQIYDPNYRSTVGELRIEAWNATGLIYSVTIPDGACVSTNAGSCVYKDPVAKKARNGLAYFRVLYQAGKHGNKIWLQSYGDLSAATDPVMSFLVYRDDILYAAIVDEVFKPTHNGWVGF
jgi:hypothetical protein